jgi:hypothetical protein
MNECEEAGYCPPPGTCTNLMGSSLCSCPPGYRLDPATATCQDVNECLVEQDYCQDGLCNNTVGGAICECEDGWRLDAKARKCVDMREGTCFDDYRYMSFTRRYF